jgi:hypothetical protein
MSRSRRLPHSVVAAPLLFSFDLSWYHNGERVRNRREYTAHGPRLRAHSSSLYLAPCLMSDVCGAVRFVVGTDNNRQAVQSDPLCSPLLLPISFCFSVLRKLTKQNSAKAVTSNLNLNYLIINRNHVWKRKRRPW